MKKKRMLRERKKKHTEEPRKHSWKINNERKKRKKYKQTGRQTKRKKKKERNEGSENENKKICINIKVVKNRLKFSENSYKIFTIINGLCRPIYGRRQMEEMKVKRNRIKKNRKKKCKERKKLKN